MGFSILSTVFFMSLDTGYSLLARIFLEIPIQFRKSDKAKKKYKKSGKTGKTENFLSESDRVL